MFVRRQADLAKRIIPLLEHVVKSGLSNLAQVICTETERNISSARMSKA